jgi:hypothetical protein
MNNLILVFTKNALKHTFKQAMLKEIVERESNKPVSKIPAKAIIMSMGLAPENPFMRRTS